MAWPMSAGTCSSAMLARAAAAFCSTSARTKRSGIGWRLMAKFSTARCVCAP